MTIHCRENDTTKRKILHAAKKEFAAHGFGGARMSSIAEIAGVNQALLHYHFSGKEKIYKEISRSLIEDIAGVYGAKIFNEVESWSLTPDLKLCAAIYVLVNSGLFIRDDELHRIIVHEIAEGHGIIHDFIRGYLMPQLMFIDEILKEGIRCGIFETINPAMLSLNILTFIKDVAHGEEFFTDTEFYNEIYRGMPEVLFNFILELSFKTLRPEGKELMIPVLDQDKKEILDSLLKEMKSSVLSF